MIQTIWRGYTRTFRGPWAAASWFVLIEGIAASVILVFMVIGLYDADTTRDQILYAVGTVVTTLVLVLIKVFSWMLIHRLALEDRLERLTRDD